MFAKKTRNYDLAMQRTRSEVGASVALVRKGSYAVKRSQNFRNDPIGGVEVICTNKIPYLVEVKEGCWMGMHTRS